jgi:CBS domain-containing protein
MKKGTGSQHVRDVMTKNPECVTDRDSILDVARIMKDKDTGVVPVVDESNGRKVIGMVTDRDIVVRGIAEGRDLSSMKVNEIMSKSVRKVKEDTPVNEVLSMMSSTEMRRMPVVNQNDELVGIVSIGDIAMQGSHDGKVGKAVEEISEAPPNN